VIVDNGHLVACPDHMPYTFEKSSRPGLDTKLDVRRVPDLPIHRPRPDYHPDSQFQRIKAVVQPDGFWRREMRLRPPPPPPPAAGPCERDSKSQTEAD
jgi:hypothetical protein